MILLQGSTPLQMLSHDQRLQYTSHDAFDDFMDALADVVETILTNSSQQNTMPYSLMNQHTSQ